MLIPMPAMPGPGSGPSNFAIDQTPWVCAVLIFQSVVCLLRMVLLLDIIGGFFMAIAIGLGWYAWSEKMHITYICYWGMMCLFNGVMDLVRFIDYAVKTPYPIFSSEMGWGYNFISALQLLIPASLLMGSYQAWYLYKDAENPAPANIGGGGYGADRNRAGGGGGGGGGGWGMGGSQTAAFSGSGQRLGSS